MTRKITLTALLSITPVLFLGQALAASDGSLGSTSTGSVAVTATIPGEVKISNLSDVDFGSITDLTSDATAQDDSVCVYNNSGSSYKLTVSSLNNDGSNFRLKNGTNFMNYNVDWFEDVSGGGIQHSLSHASQTTVGNAHQTSISCNSGASNNASMYLTIPAAQFDGAPAGAYSDTLTIEVQP